MFKEIIFILILSSVATNNTSIDPQLVVGNQYTHYFSLVFYNPGALFAFIQSARAVENFPGVDPQFIGFAFNRYNGMVSGKINYDLINSDLEDFEILDIIVQLNLPRPDYVFKFFKLL
jgi:hypothetical protein